MLVVGKRIWSSQDIEKIMFKVQGPPKKKDDVLVYLFFRSDVEMELYKVIDIVNIYSSFVRRVPNELIILLIS